MTYDKVDWHCYGQGFPEGSPRSYGATHIGLFLRWCQLKGWAGEEQLADEPEAVAKVITGGMTGTEFVTGCCDERFWSVDLTDEGNRFAEYSYSTEYLKDYGAEFRDQVYAAGEEDIDWIKFSSMVERRYKEFLSRSPR